MTGEQREWRNSRFGRVIGTVFGLGMIGIPLFVSADTDSMRAAPGQILVGVGIVAVGVAVMLAVWTSRLVLVDGMLTATQFGRSRSVRIAEVSSVEAGFLPVSGLIIKTSAGYRVRTLVSGSAGDEFWTTRAHRIGLELEDLARKSR